MHLLLVAIEILLLGGFASCHCHDRRSRGCQHPGHGVGIAWGCATRATGSERIVVAPAGIVHGTIARIRWIGARMAAATLRTGRDIDSLVE